MKLLLKPACVSWATAEAVKQHKKHVDASFIDLSPGLFQNRSLNTSHPKDQAVLVS